MLRVGLTGNVASGKSTVADVWRRLGAEVVDADVLAREAVAPGTAGLERVRQTFGDSVMRGDELDRAALRRIVFADDAARRKLEAIVHPEVARLRAREEAEARERGVPIVVHDIPLLFEVGLQDAVDVVVLVDAPEPVRAERLARHRGLSDAEIRDLFASQMPSEEKRARSDVVIDNAGTIDELERRAEEVWEELTDRAGVGEDGGRNEGRRWRMDMHIHTRISFDSLNDPDAVVRRAAELGLDRICITDHDEIQAALDLAERYPDHVIPGEEVKTGEGVDVIGLFLTEWIPGGTPARETCRRIRDQGGVVYVPHPFAPGKGGGGRILDEIGDLVHAVEGFNARLHDQALNDRARDWGRAHDLPLGAGSDAHTIREIGRGRVELPPFDPTPDAFLAALAEGSIGGEESSRWVHVASTLAKLVP